MFERFHRKPRRPLLGAPTQALLTGAAVTGVAAALFAARALLRHRRRFNLAGKTVLITGGSRGFGLVLARQFVDAGSNVVIAARTAADLDRAGTELQSRAGQNQVLTIQCDLSKPAEAADLVDTIARTFGGIDVLVNNAATIQVSPEEDTTEADYQQAMDITFWAPLHLIRAVLPHMKSRRSGRIVNIASIGGKVALPHLLPYSASKFALVGLSEGLRAELLKDNIYVTTVCPGLMRTGSPRNAQFKGRADREYAWFAAADAMPLLSGDPTRLARRVLAAVRHGNAEVIAPFTASVQAKLYALAPGLSADVLGLANQYLLPTPGGIETAAAPGTAVDAAEPQLTHDLNDRAAQQNNELGH